MTDVLTSNKDIHLQNNFFCNVFALTLLSFFLILRIGYSSEQNVPALLFTGAGLLLVNAATFLRILHKKYNSFATESLIYCEAALSLFTFLLVILLGLLLPHLPFMAYFLAGSGYLLALFNSFLYFESRVFWRLAAFSSFLLSGNIGCTYFSSKYHDFLYLEKLAIGQPFTIGGDTLFHASLSNMIATFGKITTGIDGVPFSAYHMGSHFIFGQICKLLDVNSLYFFLFGYALLAIPIFLKSLLTLTMELTKFFSAKNGTTSELPGVVYLTLACASICLVLQNLNDKILFFSGPFLGESYGLSLTLVCWASCLILYGYTAVKSRSSTIIGNILLWFFAIPLLGATMTACKFSATYIFLGVFSILMFWKKLYYHWQIVLSAMLTFASCYTTYKLLSFPYQTALRPLASYSEMQPLDIALHGIFFYLPLWTLAFACHISKESNQTAKSTVEVAFFLTLLCFLPTVFLHLAGGSVLYFLDPQYWINLSFLLAYISVLSNRQNKKLSLILSCVLILQNAIAFPQMMKFLDETKVKFASIPADPKRKLVLSRLDELSKLPWREKSRSIVFIPQSSKFYWHMLDPIYIPFLEPAIAGMPMIDGLPPEGFIGTIYYCYPPFAYGVRKSRTQDESKANIQKMSYLWGFRQLIRLDGPEMINSRTKLR